MAPHTRFKLALTRTMRCDYCNNSNVDGIQECVDCSMHICRGCVETGKLDNDEKHRMEQTAIDNLDWKKAPRARRATHRSTRSTSESISPPSIPKQKRRQAKEAERRPHHHSDHGTGIHYNSGPQFRSILPELAQNMETSPGVEFNVPAGVHDHHGGHVHGQGHFQFGSAPPGYPPGYTPSFPTHAMPHGIPPFGSGQPGHPPSQGGLAMPMGPMYGHHFSVNPGLAPRGDPRFNTPPGLQFTHSGYQAPNSLGGFQGGQHLAFSPAPTPPGSAGPGFHQNVPQPPATYNDRGYVPHGNMSTGQPGPGPGPGPFPFTGQPYGGGPFPYAPPPPPHEQGRARGQASELAQRGRFPQLAGLTREPRSRESTPHRYAEQSDNLSNIERTRGRQQQPWEHEQHSPLREEGLLNTTESPQQSWAQAPRAWDLTGYGPSGYRRQAPSDSQSEGDEVQLQPRTQRGVQRLPQQPQRQVRAHHETQLAAAGQTVPQAQKQNEQREDKPREQHARTVGGRGVPEAPAVRGPLPVTPSYTDASPITLPPITAPTVIDLTDQEDEAPDLAPGPVPPLPTLEPDPNGQLSRLQLNEKIYSSTPTVVGYAHQPFGIPALMRDQFAGRPNHFDETAARWAKLERARRPSPDDDYDDYSNSSGSEGGGGGGGRPPPGQPPPGRGKKRTFSQASSAVDSTLSVELEQPLTPAAAAAVPNTDALRHDLRENVDIARARREEGERAALDMAAAANTLQGGGRGLGGVADAQVVANDREIRRRLEDIGRKESGRGRGAVEVAKGKDQRQPSGDGGAASGSGGGGSARGRST